MFLSLLSAAGDSRPSSLFLYLSCKDPTEADDDQDVEDGRADDGTHSDVSFGDENPWGGSERRRCIQRSTVLLHNKQCFRLWLCMIICQRIFFNLFWITFKKKPNWFWPRLLTEVLLCYSPMREVKSSGAELPAAMNVAPATSSLSCRFW